MQPLHPRCSYAECTGLPTNARHGKQLQHRLGLWQSQLAEAIWVTSRRSNVFFEKRVVSVYLSPTLPGRGLPFQNQLTWGQVVCMYFSGATGHPIFLSVAQVAVEVGYLIPQRSYRIWLYAIKSDGSP